MALLRAAGSLSGLARSAQGTSPALACSRVVAQRALYAAEAAPEAAPETDGSVTQVRRSPDRLGSLPFSPRPGLWQVPSDPA